MKKVTALAIGRPETEVSEQAVADGATVPIFHESRLPDLRVIGATRASEMEHAIRHEIHVKLAENPAFFQSLRERLEQIISALKAKRLCAAEALQLMLPLREDLQRPGRAAEKLRLSPTGHAIYGLLRRGNPGDRTSEPPPVWEDEVIAERSKVQFGTTAIHYRIRRSRRVKTVAATVDPRQGVQLTAPEGVAVERLDGIVKRKAQWILSK